VFRSVTAPRASIAAPYLRVLRKASQIAGGDTELAAILAVPVEKLRIWLAGEVVPPIDVYLGALEIVQSKGQE
jgi:hypothetical protein